MLTIYGIKNCDIMQKAMKWLDARKIPYRFHDYKELGIDRPALELWLQHFPTDKLINTKSTTYRGLTDDEKASITDKHKAIQIMLNNTSIIKRPLWDFGTGKFYLGWNEQDLSAILIA